MYPQKFNIMIWGILLTSCLLFVNIVTAQTQSSENYKLKKSSFNQGGNQSNSENSKVFDTIGQSSALGMASSENYAESSGFLNKKETGETAVNENITDLLPEKFDLRQNYPNPFNPSTTIQFDLPKKSNVVLRVYNVGGQLIETLVSGNREAGQYHSQWNAAHLSNGIYFYKIQAGDFVAIKKMVLLK